MTAVRICAVDELGENEALRIEEALGSRARFAGGAVLPGRG